MTSETAVFASDHHNGREQCKCSAMKREECGQGRLTKGEMSGRVWVHGVFTRQLVKECLMSAKHMSFAVRCYALRSVGVGEHYGWGNREKDNAPSTPVCEAHVTLVGRPKSIPTPAGKVTH
jgi:hypothetical protein